MSTELLITLAFGVVLMTFFMALQMKAYKVTPWKSIIISASLVMLGYFGSSFWFFVENFSWGGRSFYGVVFLAPIAYLPISKLIKINYYYTLDFLAPSGCITLALVKIQCLKDRCCEGKIIGQDENYVFIRFPSQIVEMVAFLIIAVVLFVFACLPFFRGTVFQCFLILYGFSRFFLDFFRETQPTYFFGLSVGSFWSLCAFILGAVWLILILTTRRKQKHKSS